MRPLVTVGFMHLLATAALAAAVALPSQDEMAVVAMGDAVAVARVTPGGPLIVEGLPAGSPSFTPAPGRELSWPAAAATPRGLVVAWVEGSAASARLLSVEITAEGKAGVPASVSSASARWSRFPSVAVAPDGEVWIAWVDGARETDNVVVAHGQGGKWSAPEVVSLPDASEDLVPQMTFDASGAPLVIWAGHDGHEDEILWSRRGATGFSAEARVHPDNAYPDVTPWAARDARGVVHVAWSGYDGSSYQVSWASFDGRSWSAPARVSPGTGAATLPRVVADGNGALILWNQYDGKTATSVPGVVMVGANGIRAVPSSQAISPGCRPAAVRRGNDIELTLADGARLRRVAVTAKP